MDAVFPDEPGPDLFELANSLAALLDAPVTIEDLASRVIAFSADQSTADEGRHRTVLSMQQPSELGELQRRHGVFRRVHESPGRSTSPMSSRAPCHGSRCGSRSATSASG